MEDKALKTPHGRISRSEVLGCHPLSNPGRGGICAVGDTGSRPLYLQPIGTPQVPEPVQVLGAASHAEIKLSLCVPGEPLGSCEAVLGCED